MPAGRLATKLRLKPGHRIAILNAPAGFEAALEAKELGLVVSPALASDHDAILCFATRLDAVLNSAAALKTALSRGGILWVCYPKLSSASRAGLDSDLSRDTLRCELQALGLEGVAMVAIDDTWSALRFRVVS